MSLKSESLANTAMVMDQQTLRGQILVATNARNATAQVLLMRKT